MVAQLVVVKKDGTQAKLVENGNLPTVGDAAVTVEYEDDVTVADLILTEV